MKRKARIKKVDLRKLYRKLFIKLDKVSNFSPIFYRFKNLNELIIGYFTYDFSNTLKVFYKISYNFRKK